MQKDQQRLGASRRLGSSWLRALVACCAVGLAMWTSSAMAADVTITEATTYGSNQNIDTLTVNAGQTLTLQGNAQVTVGNLVLGGTNSRIVFGSANARLNVNGTATLSGSSARIEGQQITLRGGTWNLTGSSARIVGNVDMEVNTLNMSSSSAYISATGYGFASATGPGAGVSRNSGNQSGTGASHVGKGYRSANDGTFPNYYDSSLEPTEKGSGGGAGSGRAGGAGGGLIRIVVAEVLTINGYMQANGANGAAGGYRNYYGGGGGAGGGINIKTDDLRGTGYFQALGGTGGGGHNSYRGGGGGGGRVVVYYNDNNGFTRPYNSSVRGGYGYQARYAESGTLAFIDRGANAGSRLDDELYVYGGWRWQDNDGTLSFKSFDAYNSTVVLGPDAANKTITFSDSYLMRSSARWEPNTHAAVLNTKDITLQSSASILSGEQPLEMGISGDFLMQTSSQINAKTLTVKGTSTTTMQSSNYVRADNIQWTGKSLTTSTSSYFETSGRGFAASTGPGAGVDDNGGNRSGSGASHGGKGNRGFTQTNVNNFYGQSKTPLMAGSGGGAGSGRAGGKGGGIIRVQLTDVLNHSGYMQANGANGLAGGYRNYYGSGGGAGGVVYVSTGTLSGSGRFQALGGTGGGGHNSYRGGGGGGGRIFVDYNTLTNFTNRKYSTVRGGYGFGAQYAENGTMAFHDRNNNDLYIVEAWRWQQNDGAHSYRNLSIEDSTTDSSAEVRDDGNAVVVTATGDMSMDTSSIWQATADTRINTTNFTMASSSQFQGTTATFNVSGEASMVSSPQINTTTRLELTGNGNWTLNSSARLISPDVFYNNVGTVSLNNSSYIQGNQRGTLDNLRLLRSNAYLSADGYGYGGGTGPGAGKPRNSGNQSGTGGSHGGYGYRSANDGTFTAYYDRAKTPTMAGSGGGAGTGRVGGAGGGTIILTVNEELENSGQIRADGRNGIAGGYRNYYGSGGGGGGGIYIESGELKGSGVFYARGGAGGGTHSSLRGGGGGGGRVAIYFDEWTFSVPQNSLVNGGTGYLSKAGEVGTLAFIQRGEDAQDPKDDSYFVYGGWRWQGNDEADHHHANFTAYNNTQVSGPDSADEAVLTITEKHLLQYDSVWRPILHDTVVNTNRFEMDSRADLLAQEKTLTVNVADVVRMEATTVLDAKRLTVTGTSTATLNSTASVRSDNIQWTSRNLTLSSSANFTVSSRGYAGSTGPGKGLDDNGGNRSGSGGTHGGQGHRGFTQTGLSPIYGKAKTPIEPGSGGGRGTGRAGGNGGGVIRVQVSDTLAINGYFYADGANGIAGGYRNYYGSAGGAGGSIWVTTDTLAGAGRFQALGGTGGGGHNSYRGGGGGGGRIFVEYNRASDFTNRKYSSVRGGYGYGAQYGQTGTLAFFDRANNDLYAVEGWRWQDNDGNHNYRNLSIEDSTRDTSALVRDDNSNPVINVTGALSMDSSAGWNLTAPVTTINTRDLNMVTSTITGANKVVFNTSGTVNLNSTSQINVTDGVELKGSGNWNLNSSSRIISKDVFFNNIGTLDLNNSSYVQGNQRGTLANLRLQRSNTYLSADFYGFASATGPGAGRSRTSGNQSGTGGSHGGYGYRSANDGTFTAYYDKAKTPTMAGSGGGAGSGRTGGAGGGTIVLTVNGELKNSGQIRADGQRGNYGGYRNYYGGGGGGGGAIYIESGELTGSGYFYARGGDGGGGHSSYRGGGGGGGRVAIYFNEWNFSAPQSSLVYGGSGYSGQRGEVGTLAFIHRGTRALDPKDDSYFVYGGWRWQDNDDDNDPHHHANFTAYNSTLITGPDSDDQPITIADHHHMRSSAIWRPSTHDTQLSSARFTMDSSSQILSSTKVLRMDLEDVCHMHGGSIINSREVHVTGSSDYNLNSSARVLADNIQWAGRNLALHSSSAQFNVNGRGLAGSTGPGAGYDDNSGNRSGSGASHGGKGNRGFTQTALRNYYGSAIRPVTAGSGGGRGTGRVGGKGGGIIRVQLTGTLDIDGYFYADGAAGAAGGYRNYYGAGGGSGGSIWVTTNNLRGTGRFHAMGGTGGGGHNSYRGGGGGGGRIFVEYNDPAGFTNPQYSSVRGGYGYGAQYSNNGTLAFYERDVADLWIVEAWRWQQDDAPFNYRNLKITDSIQDSTAWVRDDGNSTRVDVGVMTSMDASSLWDATAFTDLRTTRLSMSNSRIKTNDSISIAIAGDASLVSSSIIEGPSVRLTGAGGWNFNSSSRVISSDLLFDQTGTVTLDNGSYLNANIRGVTRDLLLNRSNTYIQASGLGFASATGPGAGRTRNSGNQSGTGGAGGGAGQRSANDTYVAPYYGDLLQPAEKGSGGGAGTGRAGGAGGGSIALTVSREFKNLGNVYANGNTGGYGGYRNYYGGGGGGGGSIYIDANQLTGTGYYYARGGQGGGGHILIAFISDVCMSSNKLLYVEGGSGYLGQRGGYGTAAYFNKEENHLYPNMSWRWETANMPYNLRNLTPYNSTLMTTEGPSVPINVQETCHLLSSVNWDSQASDLQLSCGALTMDSGSRIESGTRTATITTTGNVILNGSAFIRARVLALLGSGDITLKSSAKLYGNVNLAGNSLTLETTSTQIIADGYGYGAGQGEGAGHHNNSGNRSGSGGSHGGLGNAGYAQGNVRPIYGNIEAPEAPGSGGGNGSGRAGGAGGGTVRINMTNQISLNGYIYARGANGAAGGYRNYYGGGGGAGGSVFLETNNFIGTGQIYVNGGTGGGGHNSYRGGGGGGGRVATCVLLAGFNGRVHLNGGYGYLARYAQPGTFYNNCTPVLPEAATVITTGLQTPSAGVFGPETSEITVAQFQVREITNRNPVTIRSIRIDAAGSADDAALIREVRFYHDINGDGQVDDNDDLIGTGAYQADNGNLTFSNLSIDIAAGTATNFLVVYDLNDFDSAFNNRTFSAQVALQSSFDIVKQGSNNPVPLYGAPANGPSHRLYETPPPYVTYLTPQTVSQGVENFITLYGNYFNEASKVELSDANGTDLTIVSIYRSGTRMGIRVPADAPTGRYHVRVTTPYGTNTTSRYQLQIQASCNTGFQGVCAAGIDRGNGCEPRYIPEQLNEVCGNGVDEDCNGEDLDCRLVDADGDGFTPADGDCNDNNRNIFPRDGLGCSAARDDLLIDGVPRAVSVYSPVEDGGDTAWTNDASATWYQAAADTLVDSSAVFTEEGDYAEVPDSILLQPFGDTITVGAWARMDNIPTTGNHVVFAKGPSGGETYMVYWDAVHRCWVGVIQTTAGRFVVRAQRNLTARAWVNVSLVYNGTQLILYLDGVAAGSVACNGNLVHTTSVMRVGGGHAGYRTWIGRIDEVLLFGRVVTQTDLADMCRLNRLHQRKNWGNQGPVVRFSYDFGPYEHTQRIGGTFRGRTRITGRSSMANFPTFCSIVGTSTGFDIWDEPSGKLWARFWTNGRIPNSGVRLESVDYVSAAYGRIYLGSHTGAGGMMVLDFQRDTIEHWTTAGISTYSGGIGVANRGFGYGAINGNGLRLPNNIIRSVKGWTRNGDTPYVGVTCDDGVWVVRGTSAPYIAAAYLPQYDTVNTGVANTYRLWRGGSVWPVGDDIYFRMYNVDNRSWDIVAGTTYVYNNIDVNTPLATVARTMMPSTCHTVYGTRAQGAPWGQYTTAEVNWGSVNDFVIIPGGSKNPNAQGGDDHRLACATPGGIVLIDQVDSQGDNAPSFITLRGEGNGVNTDTEKFVLHGDVDDCRAIGLRGNELFVGTQGAGVTRLTFDQGGDFDQLEFYTTNSGVALPSNNITAVSCGKNALIATDDGVASIRFPEPGPCDTGLAGACGVGREYLVGNEIACVQTVFPTGEICNNIDDNCNGTDDEHPEAGSICDRQEPFIEPAEALTVNSADCDGALVVLPTPTVHDNTDPEPALTNNAPGRFPFGNTTVIWEAEDKDGNTSTMTQTVTVTFDGQPEVNALADVSTEATSPLGTLADLGSPTGTICVPGGVTFSNDAPARFPVGVTSVTWTARGQQGRPVTFTQDVTITDTTPPSIEVGDDLIVDTQGDVIFRAPVLSDNGTPSNQITVTNNAPDEFPTQEFVTVTFTARDSAGNTATDTLRVFVRFATLPPPVLTITGPESRWLNPPVTMDATISDTSCTEDPIAEVNSNDLEADVTKDGNIWRVQTGRVSDGIHELTLTATSGCSGKTATATRLFGVDSGGQQIIFSGIPTRDVDENDRTTWPAVSNKGVIAANALLRDDLSGIASFRAELINMDNVEQTFTLKEQVFEQRSGQPATGTKVASTNFCGHEECCTEDGRLNLAALEGINWQLRLIMVDVAGNELENFYYFRSLGLREAIIAWADSIAATDSDSDQASDLLDRARIKLLDSVKGYDNDIYGIIWIGVEDAFSLVRQAQIFDNSLDFSLEADLVALLGADFMEDVLVRVRNQSQPDDSFDEAAGFINRSRAERQGGSPSDAFLALANSNFWIEEGRIDVEITQETRDKFQRSYDVMEIVLQQMQDYIDAEDQLPARDSVIAIREELVLFQEYQNTIVTFNDITPSDLEHMVELMRLTDTAEALKDAEDNTVWVRNWQWSLSQMVWVYTNRATNNASTFLGIFNPLIQQARARLAQVDVFREDKAADDFMSYLIESRCFVIGVYNFTYSDQQVDVPTSCCDLMRELEGYEPRIQVPDFCAEPVTINIELDFDQRDVTINVGETVRWINRGGIRHTVTSGEPGEITRSPLDSGPLRGGTVYIHTFTEPGTYVYFSEADPEGTQGARIIVRP